MSRGLSSAIALGVAMPMFVLLSAGTIEMGRFLYLSEQVASVAAEGASIGALADPSLGEDAIVLARSAAEDAWQSTALPGDVTIEASLTGDTPNQRVVVRATVEVEAYFDLVALHPPEVSAVRVVRLSDQD
jgi:hypothetical protein